MRLGFASVLLQFEKPQEQIPQSGHDAGALAPADSRSVLAQADIPAVVRPVFTGRPVLAGFFQQLLGAVLPWGGASAVTMAGISLLFSWMGSWATSGDCPSPATAAE